MIVLLILVLVDPLSVLNLFVEACEILTSEDLEPCEWSTESVSVFRCKSPAYIVKSDAYRL